MRSPDEQEEFLEHGRFGQGKQRHTRARVPALVKTGLAFIGVGCACIGAMALFHIGRDDGGPFFVMGSILCGVVGAIFCLGGLVARLLGRRAG
jgi:hypothetical protein